MKILVLHGDDTTKLYERFVKFTDVAKKRGWEVVNYDLDNLTNQSLFGTERFYIVRDFKILTKKDISSFDKYDGNIVIYHEGTLPVAFLKSLKDPKIEEFKLPKIIWHFLDNISVPLLHEVIKTEPIEFVFAVLVKRIRDIYWVRTEPDSFVGQPWQLSKLKNQFKSLTNFEIKEMLEKLAQIDVDSKTGKGDLLLALDLLLLKHLK